MTAVPIGSILWTDLSVPDAARIRDFYAAVTGWQPSEVDMGGYADFNMTPAGAEKPAAGICHAQGANASLPPQWIIYIRVADLEASLTQVKALGGNVIHGPFGEPGNQMCIIRDPAGAVAGLMQFPD